MPDVIVPRKCVAELRKLLDESGDNAIQIDLSASKIRFTFDNAVLTSKLIDGTFPDYSRVIPTANDKLLKIDPKSLSEGVDRVATIATEKTRAVKVVLEKDKVTLSVTSPENGTAAEEVPGSYGSDGFEIARRDLEIRGPGEFLGARQSGQAMLRFADLEKDQWLVERARDLAAALLAQQPAVAEAHLARWLGEREDFLRV
jgi:hypothetical protein